MQTLLVYFIFTVFLCFTKPLLSNNVPQLPQLRAGLTSQVLANITSKSQQVALLHQAAKLGQIQMVKLLLAEGVTLGVKDEEGKLAYEIAFGGTHIETAKLLLEETVGIERYYIDDIISRPLNLALLAGNEDTVRKLIRQGATVVEDGVHKSKDALAVAALVGKEAMLLRALAAEDSFGGFGTSVAEDSFGDFVTSVAEDSFGDFVTSVYDARFIDWIGMYKLIPVIKDMLADPQLVMSSSVRAQLAVLADDEVMFQQALDEGVHHPQVWSLFGFRPMVFGKVNARLEEGSLFHAAAHGNREAMAALLAEGADINAVDEYGWSALDYAVFGGQAETTCYLCEADAEVSVFEQAEDLLGVDAPTVEILRVYAGDKHLSKEDWLHYYLRKGQTARAINHIKSHSDPNKLIYMGVTAAHDVGKYKHRKDIDGASLFLHMGTALHAAALYGDLELVKYLIETMHMDVNYPNSDYPYNTALHMAAAGNHVEVASYLLARGADVHARDRNDRGETGLTAMHYAAAYGNLKMVMFLAENHANINAVGFGNGDNYWQGITPLQLAIEGEANLALAEFLIKKLGWFRKRAKINRADGVGLTPLYRAVRSKNANMVALLLENGADPAVLTDGDEFLIENIRHYAVAHEDPDFFHIVKLLERY